MRIVFRGFLGNRWPLSSPVSIFQTDLTPITLCKGRKHSAPRIGDDDFRGWSPLLMLCMSTVFLSFLDNHRPLSSPVLIFLTNSTNLSLYKGRKCSAARIGYRDFHGPGLLVHEHSNSHLSRQPHLLCNIDFAILEKNRLLECSHSLTIFIRAIQVRQIWIRICYGHLHSWIFWEPSAFTVWNFNLHNSVFFKDQNDM
jgi:hypothetical protein